MASARATEKYYGIEVLRGTLAICVMAYHYYFVGPLHGFIAIDPAGAWASYGRFAVQAFFIVSGFVIAFSSAHGNATLFTASRLSRLLPAAVICSTLTYLASQTTLTIDLGETRWLASATLLPLLVGFPIIDWGYWSLIVEMQFYLLVAALLALSLKRYLIEILTFLAVAGAIFLAFEIVEFDQWRPVFLYAGLFAIGVILHDVGKTGLSYRLAAFFLVNFILSSVAMGYDDWPPDQFVFLTDPLLRGFLTTALIIALFIVAWRLPIPDNWRPTALWLGGISYPLYLLHHTSGYILIAHFHEITGNMQVAFALNIGLQFLAATIIYSLIEKPVTPALRKMIVRAAETVFARGFSYRKVEENDRT